MKPILSDHFAARTPSAIRLSQVEFLKRIDGVKAINTAIGNVSLPMHPAMVERMLTLDKSPFKDGVVKYSTSVGEVEANRTVLHLIGASGFSTEGLYSQMTDGASAAMELALLGVGPTKQPILLLDPTYSNYPSMAERVGRSTVAIPRHLGEGGKFTLPDLKEVERVIQEHKPAALLVIPYDNPTGQFFPQKTLNELGKLCAKYNLWMISDEAYREVFYTGEKTSSIWGVEEIRGRRISIESVSKIWNACGLRVGALVTDHKEFHEQAVAESTSNLCSNVLGQYIFSALLHESKEKLQAWFTKQRAYYSQMAKTLTAGLKKEIPGLIVSSPDAALYTVVDFRGADWNAAEFVMYAAKEGNIGGETLLLAPMAGFYSPENRHLGRTQMRIAYVEPPEVMGKVPRLLSQLLAEFCRIH